MKDKIFIVTHKKIEKILKKEGYSYIQVNGKKNGNLGFEFIDNKGDNISEKNPNYCELTALYWIWKNYKCNKNTIIGLCHYRRFFKKVNNKISVNDCKNMLENYDIILPKKFKFSKTTYNYYFENGAGKEKDLIQLRKIIENKYPEYISSFDYFCSQYEGHYCNMMICKKSLFDKYCTWLFDILFELEKNTDLSNYSVQEARIYGYLSELLLNVYVIKNNLKIKELRIVNTEEKFVYKLKKKFIVKLKKIGGVK